MNASAPLNIKSMRSNVENQAAQNYGGDEENQMRLLNTQNLVGSSDL